MNLMPAPRTDLTLDEIIEDLRQLTHFGVFPPAGKYPQGDPSPRERMYGDPEHEEGFTADELVELDLIDIRQRQPHRPLNELCADVDRLVAYHVVNIAASTRSGRW